VTPPSGYAVRPSSEDDLHAIADLLRAFEVWELGRADHQAREQLLDDFSTPGFDPARDTWFVTDETGGLAGWVLYKDSEPGGDSAQGYGRVHPNHRGRGLGAFLVDTVDRRWITSSADPRPEVLRHWISPSDDAAATLFASRGFTLARREFHLERGLGDFPSPTPPRGVHIRRLRGDELRALHELNADAFARHWGFSGSTFEEFTGMFAGSLSDPGLAWVADEGGVLVGEALLGIREDGGWIEVLGVRSSERRRGIGRALLRTAFAELARRGCSRALLSVDAGNETGAVAMYLGEGMTVRREWHVVEKRLH
jgi:mycothiol synthase